MRLRALAKTPSPTWLEPGPQNECYYHMLGERFLPLPIPLFGPSGQALYEHVHCCENGSHLCLNVDDLDDLDHIDHTDNIYNICNV